MAMLGEYALIFKLIWALLAGYLLGSIPFAYIAARCRGVDIFTTGSRTAGTANVFWNIGRGTGLVVLVGDVAKGSAAVIFAELLGLPWPMLLLVGGAAVLGHWKSVFSGFRGGDGMAALMGVTISLEPILATLGLLIGTVAMLLLWRSPLRGAGALSTCFIVMLGLSQYYQIDRDLVMGLVALAMLVLFRSLIGLRHRSRIGDVGPALDLGLDLDPDPDSDSDQESELGSATPENR